MKTLVLVLTVAVAVVAAIPVQWLELRRANTFSKITTPPLGDIITYCNKSIEPLIINGVSFNPDPPKKGDLVTVVVNYTLTVKVTAGSVKVSATLDGLPVYDSTLDLCEVLDEAGLTCPVSPTGKMETFKISKTLPDIGGHVTANAEITDQDGKELACVEIDLHL